MATGSPSPLPPPPRIPPVLPRLEGPSGMLARAVSASRARFSLRGRDAAASGDTLRGVLDAQMGTWRISEVDARGGPAAAAVVGALSVRREMVGPSGSLLETVLVPAGAAGLVFQWSPPDGSGDGLALTLSWRIQGAAGGALHPHASGDVLLVTDGGGASSLMALVRPAPVRWDVAAEGDGVRIRVSVEAPAGEPITLLMAAGADATAAAAALGRTALLGAHERRAEQDARDARDEGLALHTGVADLDEALEWAKARIRNGARGVVPAAAPTEGTAADPAVWVALGALAGGDSGPARALLAGALPSSSHLWLAARYALWTGDPGALRAHRARVEQSIAGGAQDVFAVAAWTALADAFEGAGERALAASLRQRAAAEPVRTGRRLPVVGGGAAEMPAAATAASPLPFILSDTAAGPYLAPQAPPVRSVDRALRAWALLTAGDPETGYALLRAHLAAGLEGGVGLWPERADGSGDPDDLAAAALAPAAVLFGLLGARADAPAGRVRLAPRFPAAWARFSVTGIGVGDARISLDYVRDEGAHLFTVRQVAGRIPLMLIFEPEVAAAEVGEVQVDGRPADLDRFRRPGRTGVRVQLPLDGDRTVRLDARHIP